MKTHRAWERSLWNFYIRITELKNYTCTKHLTNHCISPKKLMCQGQNLSFNPHKFLIKGYSNQMFIKYYTYCDLWPEMNLKMNLQFFTENKQSMHDSIWSQSKTMQTWGEQPPHGKAPVRFKLRTLLLWGESAEKHRAATPPQPC